MKKNKKNNKGAGRGTLPSHRVVAIRLVNGGDTELLPVSRGARLSAELYVGGSRLGMPGAIPLVVERKLLTLVKWADDGYPSLELIGVGARAGKDEQGKQRYKDEHVLPLEHQMVMQMQEAAAGPPTSIDGLLPAIWRVCQSTHPALGSSEVRETLQQLESFPEFGRLQKKQLAAGRIMLPVNKHREVTTLGFAVQGTSRNGIKDTVVGKVPFNLLQGCTVPERGLRVQFGTFWQPEKTAFGQAILV